MKVLFTGGGTLGPVTPLLAVVEAIKRLSDEAAEMVWIGTRRGPERKLVEEAGIKFLWLYAPKWRRYFDVRNFFVPLALHLAAKIAWFQLLKIRPDVVVTAGGFVGVPVVWAAFWLRMFGVRIPCVLHNQDVRWSLANKLVAPFVQRITYALPGTVPKRWQRKAVWTGNPVRKFILSARRHPERSEGSRANARPTILVIGGGTGAKRLNEIVAEALPELTKHYQVIHLTGRGKRNPSPPPLTLRGGEATNTPLKIRGDGGVMSSGYCSFEFITSEIADLYAAADLVITRAGMGVLSELAALGKPMVIVPIPSSHQEENARYFKRREAAVVLDQSTLDGVKLTDAVRGLLSDRTRMQSLGAHAKELVKLDAAKLVSEEVMEIAKK